MPTEEESETKTPSISSRTRSQTRQEPIVTKDPTVQEVDDIFQSSSSSQAESEVSEFEGSDIEQTEQYNPRTLEFPTTTTTTPANMAPSPTFDTGMLHILDILDSSITTTPIHEIAEVLMSEGSICWEDFRHQDPGDVPTWTYPVRNNTRNSLTNVNIAKLQFFFNFIALHDHDDATAYTKAEFKIYYKESWRIRRETSAAARATASTATAATGTSIPTGPGNNNNNSNASPRYVDPDQKAYDD